MGAGFWLVHLKEKYGWNTGVARSILLKPIENRKVD
jgi:hypothetical protein